MSGLLAISPSSAEFLWRIGDAERVWRLSLPLAVAAHRDEAGGVAFRGIWQEGTGDGEEREAIDSLGSHLASWVDRDLLHLLLRAFFAAAREALPEHARTVVFQLCFPAWMGSLERRRLAAAARAAGLVLDGAGYERGVALALVKARRSAAAPVAGGWLVADDCGPDLDLYAIAVQEGQGGGELVLRAYRRCAELFSSFYRDRALVVEGVVADALGRLPAEWPVLARDDETARLLEAALPGAAVEVVALSDLLADPAPEGFPSWRLRRPWRFWLDHGDERLVSLSEEEETFPVTRELLFEIPEPAPAQVRLALRAGFAPTRSETHELCGLVLSRPADLFAAPGHLLVKAVLADRERMELAVEVLQNGRRVDKPKRVRYDHDVAELAQSGL